MINSTEITSRRERIRTAWSELAPAETFAGLALNEFVADTVDSVTLREEIDATRAKLAGLYLQREQADAETRNTMQLVINSVRGNPAFGEDSALYRAMGFVPKIERDSGLTRRRRELQTQNDAN
jgi:hypothetical protein